MAEERERRASGAGLDTLSVLRKNFWQLLVSRIHVVGHYLGSDAPFVTSCLSDRLLGSINSPPKTLPFRDRLRQNAKLHQELH